jgi:4-methyl-5(b-hydroxyethyl)-thiazole monophosphate biosynthesis
MAKHTFVFLAEGFEEVEALTPVDYLRRAGIEVSTVSITKDRTVTGAHKIPVVADTVIGKINPDKADGIILPGGSPGSTNLAASSELAAIIRHFDTERKLVAAICAAPALVLGSMGILDGRRYTCYPGLEAKVGCGPNGCPEWQSDAVVADGHLITSRSAGTAGLFALKIIEKLAGKDAAKEIAESVVINGMP